MIASDCVEEGRSSGWCGAWGHLSWVRSKLPEPMDPNTLVNILVIAFVVLSLGIHEAAHAWVANLRGDSTAKDLGRLTLNPIVHIDPIMTIGLPVMLAIMGGPIFGGAKPVPVVSSRLKRPRLDMVLVAIAGPISNLLLAMVFMVALKVMIYMFGMPESELAPVVIARTAGVNVLLAAFNMLPIPPLDGSRVLSFFLPRGLRATYDELGRFGMLFVFLLLASGKLSQVLALDPIIEVLWFLTGGRWS